MMKLKVVLECFFNIVLRIVFWSLIFQTTVFSQSDMKWETPFRKCWDYPVNADFSGDIASDNKRNIIITENNKYLISLNLENGKEIWRSNLGGKFGLYVISDKNSIYSFSILDVYEDKTKSNIRSIDGITGITNWQFEIESKGKLKFLQNYQQLFIIDDSGTINAINKINGEKIWAKTFSQNIISAILFNTNQLLIFTDQQIIRLSTNNGSILTTNTDIIFQKPIHILFLNEDEFISGNSTGNIFCFSLKSNANLWSLKVGGGISSLVKTDKGVLVTSLDNFIYLFATKNGQLKWRKRVAGRISIAPVVMNNYAVVLNSNNNIAIILDINYGKIINQINIDDSDYFLSYPVFTDNFLIFRTFKGITAFSTQQCKNKKADGN